MKMLVCTDGSEHSQKAINQALAIAEGCKVEEVAVIHVHEAIPGKIYPYTTGGVAPEQIERLQKYREEVKVKIDKMLSEAEKTFTEKNIKTRTISKEGPPADTIVKVAGEEGFDMIVLGSRGLGGLRKILLGSVSNAVMQEAQDCSVLVVK